ncbi:hypothetical protein DESC_540011 [Desulfosarcina cetonica]|nr:hypothetical protein DESC_540011 [Desulfosarcina cetonica]
MVYQFIFDILGILNSDLFKRKLFISLKCFYILRGVQYEKNSPNDILISNNILNRLRASRPIKDK